MDFALASQNYHHRLGQPEATWKELGNIQMWLYISRPMIVSRRAKKKQEAIRNERVSYLQVALV